MANPNRKEDTIKPITQPNTQFERRPSSSLWDTLIRIGLIAGLGLLCFQALSPFLKLLVWSIILAVTLYPLHQFISKRIGERPKLTSVIFVIVGIALIVVPTWLLMNSLADSVQRFVGAVQNNTLQIPPPSD